MTSTITHVIFDLDGLLIDSETAYTECCNKLCDQFGKKYTMEIKAEQMGKPPDEAARIIIDKLSLPITIQQHHELLNAMLNERFPLCGMMPGVTELIKKLHNMKIPMCIATGSDQRSFDAKLQNKKWLLDYMSHSVCSGTDSEVKLSKPAPDCFLVAANRFSPKPASMQNILVFEDSTNGVRAALAAGMRVVWCPDPNAMAYDPQLFSDSPHVNLLESLTNFDFNFYQFSH